MNDYKLVPVEPTEAMIDAARDIHEGERYLPTILYTDIYKAMLAAAPAVQGEAVAWSGWGCQYPGKMPRLYGDRRIAELNCDWENGDQVLYFTAAPQPTEQQPAPDVRCEGCGYMTRHREHMGCVRAAKQNQADVSDQASPTPFESAINRVREASDRIQNAVDEWERHIAASGMPSPLTRIVPEGFLAHLRSVILGIDSAYRGSPSPENQYLLGQCVDALTGLIPDIDAALAAHRREPSHDNQ